MSDYKVGSVLKNEVGQFTKIISEKNGVYGISGWTTLKNAEKATIATQFMNSYGLKYANCTVLKAGKADKAQAPAESTTKTPAPKKVVAKKVAPKKAPKKVTKK